ncbi:hypothetical protein [Desulfitobacterium metallireducens]|uniref:Uncharacterized protein n=1 Tax=Desulfitobacterium metallireducens DSM 15288 TaxID=871968 RepID=W0EH01_9FIRM|nr:hypothetical protein [Desulfitobacterium metallireducens]AHF08489.1 hypothetical protein DESME_04915 [Desulfitobacterium metallireducens DSM 15288]
MKIKSNILGWIIFIVIFGTVGITSGLDLWKTTNDKIPATFSEGSLAGQYNPADIRGSYTFAEIQNAFEIPVEDLGIAFGIKDSSNYASFQVKELETIYSSLAADGKEVGTGSVRTYVALYKGLPITLADGTYLPKPAVDILKAKAPLTQEQFQFLDTHSVEVP